jgi:predicted extracellular nuclease
MSGDTLDVMVAHLPSMLGGRLKSEPFRVHVAEKIRQTADSIQSVRHKPKIIIIGDFNDYPDSKPVAEVVGAVRPPAQNDSIKANSYYNLMNGKHKKNGKTIGTYRYKGYWNIIDQCIVNGLLLTDTENLCTTYEDAQICDFEFLLEPDLKFGGMKPFRTYNGMKYREGYSDHLPIRIVFRDSFSR